MQSVTNSVFAIPLVFVWMIAARHLFFNHPVLLSIERNWIQSWLDKSNRKNVNSWLLKQELDFELNRRSGFIKRDFLLRNWCYIAQTFGNSLLFSLTIIWDCLDDFWLFRGSFEMLRKSRFLSFFLSYFLSLASFFGEILLGLTQMRKKNTCVKG